MAITTFAELKTAVANWLDDDNLTSRIPEFVALAEDRIAQQVRLRVMETSSDLTVSSQEVALPTRYLRMRRIYLTGSPVRKLDFLTPLNFWTIYLSTETGKPKAFTIEGDNIVFGPIPDTSYTGKMLFYQRLAAFSSDSDTNTMLTDARGLYLYGSLLEAAVYLEDDPAILKWSALFDDAVEKVEEADMRDRYSGDALVQRSDVFVR